MKIIHIFAPQNHSNRSVCDVGKMASHSFVTRHCEAVQRHDHSRIEYIYAADGTKLRTIHRPASSSALTDSIDYIGNLILKNGQPSMYIFDGGYASFGTNGAVDGWHYYIQDYMGNNRMVVNKNGTVEQVTHYYPYGGVIGDISTNENVQKYKFEGKELDRTFGLDNYDVHARQYFAMAPMWDRIDPLAEKYYGISPYAYCGGDPVNYMDPNGEDIIILIAPDGANGFGHMAILIQDEDSKWFLYSVNGTQEHLGLFGASKGNDIKQGDNGNYEPKKGFDSPNDFFLSSWAFDDIETTKVKYTEGYLIETSFDQDREIEKGVKEYTGEDGSENDYNIFSNNCAQAVQNGLQRAGLKNGNLSFSGHLLFALPLINHPILGTVGLEITKRAPNAIYNRIKQQNPKGTTIINSNQR